MFADFDLVLSFSVELVEGKVQLKCFSVALRQ